MAVDAKWIELETRFKEERDRLLAIISSMGEGLFVVDSNCLVVMLNRTAERILKITEKDVVGKDLRDRVILLKGDEPVPKENRYVVQVMKTRKSIQSDLRDDFYYVASDGRHVPIILSVAPLLYQDKVTGAVMVFRDITEERKIDNVKTEFFSVAAHQLRTPLGAMRWNLEMLLNNDLGPLSPKVNDLILQIYRSNQRMIRLVNDLLSVSRIEQRRIPNDPRPINVLEVIEDVIQELDIEFKKSDIKVSVDTKNKKMPSIVIDSRRFRDVALNLVSNAIKYNTKGGTVTITLQYQSGHLIFSVQDTGIGIPQKDQADLFTKFHRAENAILKEPEGSGLGLYIVKSYVGEWNGTIHFESTQNKGTVFTIEIPVKEES